MKREKTLYGRILEGIDGGIAQALTRKKGQQVSIEPGQGIPRQEDPGTYGKHTKLFHWLVDFVAARVRGADGGRLWDNALGEMTEDEIRNLDAVLASDDPDIRELCDGSGLSGMLRPDGCASVLYMARMMPTLSWFRLMRDDGGYGVSLSVISVDGSVTDITDWKPYGMPDPEFVRIEVRQRYCADCTLVIPVKWENVKGDVAWQWEPGDEFGKKVLDLEFPDMKFDRNFASDMDGFGNCRKALAGTRGDREISLPAMTLAASRSRNGYASYLPSAGELQIFGIYKPLIDKVFEIIGHSPIEDLEFWSSTEVEESTACTMYIDEEGNAVISEMEKQVEQIVLPFFREMPAGLTEGITLNALARKKGQGISVSPGKGISAQEEPETYGKHSKTFYWLQDFVASGMGGFRPRMPETEYLECLCGLSPGDIAMLDRLFAADGEDILGICRESGVFDALEPWDSADMVNVLATVMPSLSWLGLMTPDNPGYAAMTAICESGKEIPMQEWKGTETARLVRYEGRGKTLVIAVDGGTVSETLKWQAESRRSQGEDVPADGFACSRGLIARAEGMAGDYNASYSPAVLRDTFGVTEVTGRDLMPAVTSACGREIAAGGRLFAGYLPTVGEFEGLYRMLNLFDRTMGILGGELFPSAFRKGDIYHMTAWSSREYNDYEAWVFNFTSGQRRRARKTETALAFPMFREIPGLRESMSSVMSGALTRKKGQGISVGTGKGMSGTGEPDTYGKHSKDWHLMREFLSRFDECSRYAAQISDEDDALIGRVISGGASDAYCLLEDSVSPEHFEMIRFYATRRETVRLLVANEPVPGIEGYMELTSGIDSRDHPLYGCAEMTCPFQTTVNRPTGFSMAVGHAILPSQFGNGANLNWMDISGVESLAYVFAATDFRGDISLWDTGNVRTMTSAFAWSRFDGDISGWDTRSLGSLAYAFICSDFDGDISGWDVSGVSNFHMAFLGSKFRQDISGWQVMDGADVQHMLAYTPVSEDIPLRVTCPPARLRDDMAYDIFDNMRMTTDDFSKDGVGTYRGDPGDGKLPVFGLSGSGQIHGHFGHALRFRQMVNCNRYDA